ncbi:acyl-[ACP]--phospholipid O-acyltransferase [Occallatibacter riparius]|uniref:Acyl-[ACP]--phospholipid O-acyltransferase n=1 Tax=Occallatibacter riparius TaxID=1002689 RepID=A0A9J7BN23_9BACT|nr:acyl-[ACP]--phospholipid O-acyltransferase [Occallatibacter riparius]UWZ83905.1 acyl-[ACP]--phospholipid O-acyltransferase [Occallatibacter riparius]
MSQTNLSHQPDLLPGPDVHRSERGFWALIVTQFQGAFSDNVLRNLLLAMVVGMGLDKGHRDTFVSIVTFLFSVPFVIFSMSGGWLADHFSKRKVTLWTKVMEVGAMTVATAGLALHSQVITLAALGLVATQAALFGPSKYGLLPELLPSTRLSWGNGVIELGTFLAIILGTVAGAGLAERFPGEEIFAGYILIGLAGVGFLTSLGIDRVPAAAPAKRFRINFVGDLWKQIGIMRRDQALFLAVLGNTYFWFLGSLLFATVVVYGPDVLHIGPGKTAYLNAALAIGIGIGSMAAGIVSGKKIEYGLIPLGSIGMTCTGVVLGVTHTGIIGSAVLLSILGFWAGFFAVPVNALIQHRPDEKDKGGIIAAANLLSFIGIALSSGVYYVFTSRFINLDPKEVILAASAITAAGTVYVLILLPEWFGRLILFFLTHTIYSLKVLGRENFPDKTGALLVCNHMSFVDAALLIASTDRPIRFLMYKGIYENRVVYPFARMMKAIPISSEQRPRDMIRSLRTATDALRNDEIVCIFAEGQITRTGQMLPFRRGLERIMKGVDAPIIPVNLDGVWGSIFSFERGRFLWKMPRKIPYPVTVSFGRPMPATSTAIDVRRAVQELQADAFYQRKRRMRTLDRAFVRTARRYALRFMMADGKTARVSFFSALTKTIYIARRLRGVIGEKKMVGLLLPPSVGGALANYALTLLGRIAVNLNYTASGEIIASCAQQCDIDVVITSKAFVERFPKLEIPGRAVFLEDTLASPRGSEKLAALVFALTLPVALLRKAVGARGPRPKIDDLATVIFSSGSTGDPKGVMLSHFNLVSNIQQVSQVFMLGRSDKVLGILPFFHSFGFMGALWMPAVNGLGVVYHPNPFDTGVISELVEKYSVTFLIATPTFLQTYMRRCRPESFGSLQFVLVGAEKLPERVALAFEDTFGIRPLEGYGCTECSPVVTVNGRDFRAPGFRQVGGRRGRIGHPLPGISVRIVDIDTGEPVAAGTPGMLLVKGPNVMQGYLGKPEKTAEVLHDGWYTTGDVALMEEDGFLAITDRLSRFSKIAGEMVPHIRIEEKLHELAGITEQVFAVTSLPDEKKGERIVVVTTLSDEKLDPVLDKLAQCDLPALWKPRANQFFRVDALPVLGTGKIDLRGVKAVAVELATARA